MDPTAPPPPIPTTPTRRYARSKLADTPNKLSGTFAPSSQPPGSTQRALQESLTGNIVFANEAIVDAIFQPSKVDDQIIVDIFAELNGDKDLKSALDSIFSSERAETKKYKSLITLFDHITTYNYQDAPLMNNDYARHVRRIWVDTHSQSIRTDPDIYLPGEIDTDAEDSACDDSNDEDDAANKNELSNVLTGVKRGPTIKTRSASRAKVAKTTARTTPSTAALTVIDDRRPDLTLVDVPVDESVLSHPYGRHSCLYMEVKVEANKKPNPQEMAAKTLGKDHKGILRNVENPPKVKTIHRQIADTARLHLATRPFMRYSLHITLCGTTFNICLFDRVGGVVSKDYDLKDEGDFETFVRIIRRATCDMDAYEMGLDPTVTPLDFLGSVTRYPRFKVEVGKDAEYYTYGFPIWQSTTLQGRGTWVFGATVDDNPNPMPTECLILKNAWRASGRLPESTLYSIINKLPSDNSKFTLRCVAEFVDGGDVMVDGELQQPHHLPSSSLGEQQKVAMHVSSHRKFVVDAKLNSHDPVLHRVVLATRGRSMVSYTSLVELLSAGECAAEGLMALYERGVDHRDVSIGNVLLGTDPSKPAGFIADLDLSSISDEAIKAAYPIEHEAIISKLKQGEWRTGTALFMSLDLLSALESHKNAKKRGRLTEFTFQHKLCHDFESLILVIVYAMLIRNKNRLAATNSNAHSDYKELLNDFWGAHSHTKLANCHITLMGVGTIRLRTIVEDVLFPDPLEAEFFRAAMRLVNAQVSYEEPITYEKMQSLFRTYIQRAQESTPSNNAPV